MLARCALLDHPNASENLQMPHHHPAEHNDIWSVEGRFQHLLYSPKGGIEGLLIDTEGIATQFVVDPHDCASVALLLSLRRDQALVVEGRETRPRRRATANTWSTTSSDWPPSTVARPRRLHDQRRCAGRWCA